MAPAIPTILPDFFVRFWGVRGSLACPGADYVRYGGNTSCLEIRCGSHLLIFDAGTGARPLGDHLAATMPGIDADIFFTHTHLDHIVGLPFFAPLYKLENRIRLWAGHLLPQRRLREALSGMMVEPLFPVPLEAFAARPEYRDFRAGERLEPHPGLELRTVALAHPNGATGYRVDWQGRSICYVTDCEHDSEALDPGILDLIRGSDIFVYDCTYTDEEYPRFRGWGHSTWQEGARLAAASGAKRLVIFHHDPGHDDDVMDGIAAAAQKLRPGTIVAHEGLLLTP